MDIEMVNLTIKSGKNSAQEVYLRLISRLASKKRSTRADVNYAKHPTANECTTLNSNKMNDVFSFQKLFFMTTHRCYWSIKICAIKHMNVWLIFGMIKLVFCLSKTHCQNNGCFEFKFQQQQSYQWHNYFQNNGHINFTFCFGLFYKIYPYKVYFFMIR